jgi:hypothetical protein
MLRPQAPWRLYLLAVASFGLYLPYWILRAARDLGDDRDGRWTPAWFALGSLAAPLCALLLLDLGRRGGAGRTAGWAALLYAGLAAALLVAPARELWSPAWLALPIPFVWVQHAANRARRARGAAGAPGPAGHPAEWLLVAAGLPAALAAGWLLDGPRLRLDLAPDLDPGTVVVEPGGRFELTVPSSFWRRAEPVAAGDRGADLAFVASDGSARLLAYAHARPPATLDGVVAARREAILASGWPQELREKRTFLPGDAFALGSRAEYRLTTFAGESLGVRVNTIELDGAVVEAVASTGEPAGWLGELTAFVDSLRAAPPAAELPGARP